MNRAELVARVLKDSIVMRHELVADENAVFERLSKISNALVAVLELQQYDTADMDPGGYESDNGEFVRCADLLQAIEGELR